MRPFILSFICVLGFGVTASAQENMSPQTLKAVKEAIAFVKVEVSGLSGSGSGFVIKVDKDTALVVTNHHVIEPKVEMMVMPRPPKTKRPGTLPPPILSPRMIVTTFKNASVTVVLDSGTKSEREYKAEVLAADPERDLAILKIKDAKELPGPIDVANAPELLETLPVYTFGFPFGKVLATSKGNPAITIGKGSISSLRENDDGDLAFVQIDGALNPGNSGGPVLDASGKLVGVAVATVRSSSGIGLAVPGAELRKMLAGRLGLVHLKASAPSKGKVTVDIELALIDPHNKIGSVTLHCLPGSSIKDTTKPIDSIAGKEGVQKIELTIEKQIATGKLVLDSASEKDLIIEASYSAEPGKTIKGKAVRHSLKTEPIAKLNSDTGDKDGLTRILGGAFDPVFKEEAPDNGVLIGLELGLQKFFDYDIIRSVRPIFRNSKGEEVKGTQVGTDLSRVVTIKAKDGYAIGGLMVRSGLGIDAIVATYMRVNGDRLDPNDSYQSDHIGGKGGGPALLGGDGSLIVGIIGKSNQKDCTGIGLMIKKKATK
jgi:S1-C subfamily serine protease